MADPEPWQVLTLAAILFFIIQILFVVAPCPGNVLDFWLVAC
jgi:hypothetical protein